METNRKISGFKSWLLPSGEGVVYFEGVPTDNERALDRERTRERRKAWQPNEEAISVYSQLKELVGKQITIQLWDTLMLWSEDEGSLPFSCTLVNVYTKNIKPEPEDNRDFNQLFLEFKNPKIIKNGNLGGSPLNESNMDIEAGLFTLICSKIAWINV